MLFKFPDPHQNLIILFNDLTIKKEFIGEIKTLEEVATLEDLKDQFLDIQFRIE